MLTARRVHLDRYGYDPSGRYYGAVLRGVEPLYEVEDEEGRTARVRAPSSAAAKDRVVRYGITLRENPSGMATFGITLGAAAAGLLLGYIFHPAIENWWYPNTVQPGQSPPPATTTG